MSPVLVVGLAACTLGCQGAPEPRAIEVAVHGDGVDLALTRTAAGCLADAVITVAGDVVASGGWRLAPGPIGRELTDHGALIARVVDEPGRRSYLDATGVPLGRVGLDGTITGPARDTLGTVARDDRGLVWRDAAGRTVATITGTDDVELALALIAPSTLPPAARALVACARLHVLTAKPPP